jgi:acyl-CoA synthetase (AMP-forming)/AMP-acid ligase II
MPAALPMPAASMPEIAVSNDGDTARSQRLERMRAESGRRTVGPVLAWALRQPDAPALIDEQASLSYGQLAAAIDEAVGTLQSFGVVAGDRILVVGENSVPLAVLLLAASQLGACAVIENARRALAETRVIAEHCLPRCIFFVFAQSADAEQHARSFGAERHETAALGAFAVAAPPSDDNRTEADMPADVAIIIYTTGTTGQPKGVMLTHGNLSFIASMMVPLREMGPRDRVYGVLPITHVMGHASAFLGALHSGAALYLAARFVAQRCVEILLRQRITAIQGAPAMFAKIVEHCRAQGIERIDSVRFIGSGGAPIDATVKQASEKLFGRMLHNGYGLTEAAALCWTRFDDDNRDESVGRPLPGVELQLRGADGNPVGEGEVGELWIRGPNLMCGYFRNRELTAKVVDRRGWFNTQDLARIGADGRVFIVGRTKELIIRSGFKVYPLEVESVLGTHPAVLHVAVVGRAVPGNEEVVAYVELAQGARTTPEDLLRHAAPLLAPYKRPAEIVIVPSLPLAANGKVLKSQLLAHQPGGRR